ARAVIPLATMKLRRVIMEPSKCGMMVSVSMNLGTASLASPPRPDAPTLVLAFFEEGMGILLSAETMPMRISAISLYPRAHHAHPILDVISVRPSPLDDASTPFPTIRRQTGGH